MAEKVTSSSPPEDKESSRCQLQGMENKSNVVVVLYMSLPLPNGRRLSDGTQRRQSDLSFRPCLQISFTIITMPCSSTHIA